MQKLGDSWALGNPPSGSSGIFQIQPTLHRTRPYLESPQRKLRDISSATYWKELNLLCDGRPYLNYPSAAAEGIQNQFNLPFCRSDLKKIPQLPLGGFMSSACSISV